jgi:leader peptidase (prepilin peptidase)/N-methyltransferase
VYDSLFDMLVRSPFGVVVAALWGALWGSFFNVVIERLPRGESLLRPGSHCMSCGEPVRIYDNVPILSYLLLRGRCRHCGAGYSARYLLVELLGLGLSVACYYHAARYGTGPVSVRFASFLVEFFFVGGMIAIAFIDIRTMIIPSAITYPLAICLSAAAIGLGRLAWFDSLAGASAGFLFVFVVAEAYRLLRGHEGLGLGDGKLLAVIGGFLGWKALPLVLFLGSVQGLIVALPMLLLGKSLKARHGYRGLTDGADEEGSEMAENDRDGTREQTRGQTQTSDNESQTVSSNTDEPATVSSDSAAPEPSAEDPDAAETVPGLEDLRPDAVPFGPFLALAGVEALFFGKEIISRVSAVFDRLTVLL